MPSLLEMDRDIDSYLSQSQAPPVEQMDADIDAYLSQGTVSPLTEGAKAFGETLGMAARGALDSSVANTITSGPQNILNDYLRRKAVDALPQADEGDTAAQIAQGAGSLAPTLATAVGIQSAVAPAIRLATAGIGRAAPYVAASAENAIGFGATGDLRDPKSFAENAAIGAVAGPAGLVGRTAGSPLARVAGTAVEVGALAFGPAALEGRSATKEEIAMGVLFPLGPKAVESVARLTSASRAAFAKALDVKPSEIPKELSSKEAREAAIAAAKKYGVPDEALKAIDDQRAAEAQARANVDKQFTKEEVIQRVQEEGQRQAPEDVLTEPPTSPEQARVPQEIIEPVPAQEPPVSAEVATHAQPVAPQEPPPTAKNKGLKVKPVEETINAEEVGGRTAPEGEAAGVEGEAGGRIRVRDAAQDRVEAGAGKTVAPRTSSVIDAEIRDVQTQLDNIKKGGKEHKRVSRQLERLYKEHGDAVTREESESYRASVEADTGPVLEEAHAGIGAIDFLRGKQPARADRVPDIAKAPTKEAEQRLEGAYGLRKEPLIERIKARLKDASHAMTRAQKFLPNDAKHALANEELRLLKDNPNVSSDEAIRRVASIIDPMGEKQRAVFERYLVMKNLDESVKRGEPLRFGLKADEIGPYADRLQRAVDITPEIKKAVDTRNAIKGEILDQLDDLGLLPRNTDREWYYHQMVQSKMVSDKIRSGQTPKPTKRAFQKGRIKATEERPEWAKEYDYNTDYIEAETAWMTDALMEINKAKSLQRIVERYSVPEIREGYSEWQPVPGNEFYTALSIPESVVQRAESGIITGLKKNLSPEQIREVIALAGPKKAHILPDNIVKQLDSMKKSRLSDLEKLADGAMKAWKINALLNPKRVIGYSARNAIGDFDAAVGGAPGVALEVPSAVKELAAYHQGKLALTGDLKAARDLGVIDSAMTAKEIPDAKTMKVFQRFYSSGNKTDLNLVGRYLDKVREYNSFRENTLRLAAFKYYKSKLAAGELKHYGAAKKEVVDALQIEMGNDYAAAHLARNLLGDYGNITVFGDYLRRRLIPFWSWQEINLKRYPRFMANAIREGNAKGGVVSSAVMSGYLASRIAGLAAAAYAWNYLMYPEKEAELGPYERSNPHLILGETDTGNTIILRNISSFGDFTEWFGFPDMITLLPQLMDDQINIKTLAKEMAKAPANKIVQGVRPDIKGVGEALTGVTTFPDVFTPRRTPRGEILSNVVGLRDEFREAQGAMTGDGTRARPDYMARIIGVTNPRQEALSEIYELRQRFLEKEGRPSPPILGISKYAAIKQSAIANDYDAFSDAATNYLKNKGNATSFRAFVKSIDPIANRLNDEMEDKFVNDYLTETQRNKMGAARAYAQELSGTLFSYWHKFLKENPDMAEQANDDKEIASAMNRLAQARPVKKSEIQGWKTGRKDAYQFLRDVDKSEAMKAYQKYLASRYKNSDTVLSYMRRAKSALNQPGAAQ